MTFEQARNREAWKVNVAWNGTAFINGANWAKSWCDERAQELVDAVEKFLETSRLDETDRTILIEAIAQYKENK